MICRFCGEDISPDDPMHELLCDGRQGAVEQREPPVFDRAAGRALRDAAIERVGNAGPDFQTSALHAIYAAAAAHREFITDEVWARLSLEAGVGSDNRGMGAAMMTAKRNGWIEPTPLFRQSAMRQNHARPCRVWRSKLRP